MFNYSYISLCAYNNVNFGITLFKIRLDFEDQIHIVLVTVIAVQKGRPRNKVRRTRGKK